MLIRTAAIIFFIILISASLVQFLSYGRAESTEPGINTHTWTFDNPEEFDATETIIDNSEVTLQLHNYQWNQALKKDFIKGSWSNVTIFQKSETEIVWSDDFESGDKGWEHNYIGGGPDEWELGNVSEIPEFMSTHDSGDYLWGTKISGKYDESSGVASDYYLKSPNIDLSGSTHTEMRFWHYYDFEDDIYVNDGGIIEVSIDGVNWKQITPKGGYDGPIEDSRNPLFNSETPTWCFAGNSTEWVEERFDLFLYDGVQNFTFRFRFATNGQVPDYGWYIDDINITSTTYSQGEVELATKEIVIGDPTGNDLSKAAKWTYIDFNNPIDSDGILTKWFVRTSTSGTGKMKIFRHVLDKFILVGETDLENMEQGYNTFDCNISVKAGDYLGWYGETAAIWAGSTGSAYLAKGDINGSSDIYNWTHGNFTFPIRVWGTSRYSEGTLTSQVFDAGSAADWKEISWGEDTSSTGVNITLQTRTGNDPNPSDGTWSNWSSQLKNHEGSEIKSSNARYIQFRAKLTTEQQLNTPTLFNVSISYSKYSPCGEIETQDLIPDTVVQWLEFSTKEELNGQNIYYNYSLDSGVTWEEVPSNLNLSSVSVLGEKIRFRANLCTRDTTVSPVLREISLNYSSAIPIMEFSIELLEKKSVKPGDMISYRILYRNKGIGNAEDVTITLYLDENLTFMGEDSVVDPTMKGNVIKWRFDRVEPGLGNKTFIVDARVKDVNKEITLTTYAALNYTDIGGVRYEGVMSEFIDIKVTIEEDLLSYYLLIGLIIAVILIFFAFLVWRRIKATHEGEVKINPENVEKGIGYLVIEENPSNSYGLFKKLIGQGQKGFCITRTYPERVKKRYDIEDASILWLSRSWEWYDESIIPTNLGGLLRQVKDFMDENKDSVILFDGLEYLVVHNDFEKVLKLVHGLNELAALNDSRLIIPLNPHILEKDKVALLKRELKILG